jgi:hypothetical protein
MPHPKCDLNLDKKIHNLQLKVGERKKIEQKGVDK